MKTLAFILMLGLAGFAKGYVITDADYQRGRDQITEFMGYLNAERVSRGLVPLELRQELCTAARLHAEDMVKRNYFSHYTLGSGAYFVDRIFSAGWNPAGKGVNYWGGGGENINEGYLTPRENFDAWMNSDEHRVNMLDPNQRYAGVGFAIQYGAVAKWVLDMAYDPDGGTPGIPNRTIGLPPAYYYKGSSWEGYEPPTSYDGSSTVSVSRRASVTLLLRKAVMPSSPVNPVIKANVTASEGRVRYVVVSGRLPKGLRLQVATGNLVGRPLVVGARTVRIVARANGKASRPVPVKIRVR
jgi:hypothetical protein